MNFIRTEINLVDFMLDRLAADVHILITKQETGSGGRQYQFIFFGQNQFSPFTDTLRFNVSANATDFEGRDRMIKYLKLGLTPFIARTGSVDDIMIGMKKETGKNDTARSTATKDPWNYWVFKIGLNGYVDVDANYRTGRAGSNFTASRVTDDIKIVFEVNASRQQTKYTLTDDNGLEEKITIRNNNYNFEHFLIKSMGGHWSSGYEIGFSHNTFSNNKHSALLRAGIEYAIFPYKQVNTRYFTISWVLDARRNAYIDSTLYDKLHETLWGHSIESNLSFNQKWGTAAFGAEYHNYFHNWKYFNLNIDAEVDIRITGGLSFNIYTSASLTRDQLFLPKEGATAQEVLTRRRQLASGYSFYSSFGISYRFGSKLNNFVNPRFD